MATYEFLEHTADVGIVARGRDFGEALAGVAEGMFALMADLEGVEERQTVEVTMEASDREALVVDWLNELLYRYQAEGFLPRRFQFIEAAETRLRARCWGEAVNPARHHLRADVKAATYHHLEVQANGGWRIQVILDV